MPKVKLSHAYDGKDVGADIEVDVVTAKRLVRNGVARPSTVSDAKEVGADPEDAATKRK